MIKVVVAGSRSFNDYDLLKTSLDLFLQHYDSVTIISGHAYGADKLGERYASQKGYEVELFIPNWDLYGKRAGYLRNEDMAKNGDVLVAFWDGKSKGTQHMINLAKKHELKIWVVNYIDKTLEYIHLDKSEKMCFKPIDNYNKI